MVTTKNTKQPTNDFLSEFVNKLLSGDALLPDSPTNVLEVVGVLKSYAFVIGAYSDNLIYIADHQFLNFFPFFKYFNGEVSSKKLFRHLWHDRINFEYAEYCLKAMLWHGGGGLDSYLDTPEFQGRAQAVINAKFKSNFLVKGVNKFFPEFLIEQLRVSAYYSGLGQFWRVMADMFFTLSDLYDIGKITTIPQVVTHIRDALVKNANNPITYAVKIDNQVYEILPKSLGLTFLADTAVPYVEAVFFRGTPFQGTVSYNAQAYQVPVDQSRFQYGALYADPLPIGGAGIPPTLLMQDMRHYLPEYLHAIYRQSKRGEDDLRVQICMSFQKSMFCVTTAAITGLMPHPADSSNPEQRQENEVFLQKWLKRMENSRLIDVNP
jgi:CO2 hydration protein